MGQLRPAFVVVATRLSFIGSDSTAASGPDRCARRLYSLCPPHRTCHAARYFSMHMLVPPPDVSY